MNPIKIFFSIKLNLIKIFNYNKINRLTLFNLFLFLFLNDHDVLLDTKTRF